jgi:hypothetical protein
MCGVGLIGPLLDRTGQCSFKGQLDTLRGWLQSGSHLVASAGSSGRRSYQVRRRAGSPQFFPVAPRRFGNRNSLRAHDLWGERLLYSRQMPSRDLSPNRRRALPAGWTLLRSSVRKRRTILSSKTLCTCEPGFFKWRTFDQRATVSLSFLIAHGPYIWRLPQISGPSAQ